MWWVISLWTCHVCQKVIGMGTLSSVLHWLWSCRIHSVPVWAISSSLGILQCAHIARLRHWTSAHGVECIRVFHPTNNTYISNNHVTMCFICHSSQRISRNSPSQNPYVRGSRVPLQIQCFLDNTCAVWYPVLSSNWTKSDVTSLMYPVYVTLLAHSKKIIFFSKQKKSWICIQRMFLRAYLYET